MLKTCFCLFSIPIILSIFISSFYFLLFPITFNGVDDSFFLKHPDLNNFETSLGVPITMPWKIYDAKQLMLVGGSEIEETTKILSTINLHPVIHPIKKLALTTIGAIQYRNSSGGSYDEIYVAFYASDKICDLESSNDWFGWKHSLSVFLRITGIKIIDDVADYFDFPNIYFVVYLMDVNTELSMVGGREIWGYPKELSDIMLFMKSYNRLDYDVRKLPPKTRINRALMSKNDETVVQFERFDEYYHDWYETVFSFPVDIQGVTVTMNDVKHTMGKTYAKIYAMWTDFNGKNGDFFEVYGGTPFGDKLMYLQFDPWYWIDIPIFYSILYPPFSE